MAVTAAIVIVPLGFIVPGRTSPILLIECGMNLFGKALA